jgi:uncharacterized protein YjbJ (UPF0337 family)
MTISSPDYNPELETEGNGEKITGKVQEKIGQVKQILGN